MAPSLQNMPEGTGLFDLAPSQDESKDGFHISMFLVSCVVMLMSLLPGLVVVFSKVDVLPSVRRSVITCARPCLTLGSVVVCAAAMAAALLCTFAFSFPDCDLYGGTWPFLEWPCPAGCVAVRVHSISRLVWMLFSYVSWSMRREISKGKTKVARSPKVLLASGSFPFRCLQVLGSWGQKRLSCSSSWCLPTCQQLRSAMSGSSRCLRHLDGCSSV